MLHFRGGSFGFLRPVDSNGNDPVRSDRQAEHKIQSGESNTLQISLEKTPKMLGEFNSLIRSGLKVSFKLETRDDLLCQKMRSSLSNYRSDLVIGNLLHTRYSEIFVGSLIAQQKENPDSKLDNDLVSISRVTKTESGQPIEHDMVRLFRSLMLKRE